MTLKLQFHSFQTENHNHRKLTKWSHGSQPCHGEGTCITQWSYDPWYVGLCKIGQNSHGGEFWKNVVHWRKEWQTTQYSCLENSMNSMKRQKDMTLVDELLRSIGVQYATGELWTNSSRKNEEAGPKWKWCSVVDVSGSESKVWCYKNSIA